MKGTNDNIHEVFTNSYNSARKGQLLNIEQ